MFGRATIRLGIGPYSSLAYIASSELARASRFAAKFHYAVWFEAGRRPDSNQLA